MNDGMDVHLKEADHFLLSVIATQNHEHDEAIEGDCDEVEERRKADCDSGKSFHFLVVSHQPSAAPRMATLPQNGAMKAVRSSRTSPV